VQFLLQFVVQNRLLFTFEGLVPSSLLLRKMNTFQHLMYGSPLYKSNGFFMIEASTFSQYVGVAVIVELIFYRMNWRLVVYIVALMFSYSGTGLIVLALAPLLLVSRRSYSTIVGLGLLGLVAVATSGAWHMDIFAQRAAELGSDDSSAYSRFIAPANLIARFQFPDPTNLLFGFGPGTIFAYGLLMPYETHDPAWARVLFEYGLVGCLLFWPMLITAVFGKAPSTWLCMALLIGFLTFGGEFLDPRLQTLLLVFCTLPKRIVPIDVTGTGTVDDVVGGHRVDALGGSRAKKLV
jgi:hypothetical protein